MHDHGTGGFGERARVADRDAATPVPKAAIAGIAAARDGQAEEKHSGKESLKSVRRGFRGGRALHTAGLTSGSEIRIPLPEFIVSRACLSLSFDLRAFALRLPSVGRKASAF